MTAPLLFSVFLWWLSTGLIFCAGARGRRTMDWSMLAASLGAVVALLLLVMTRFDQSVTGAYLAFSAALTIWGWHEMTFLFGYITGPRKTACPEGAKGWRRFFAAVAVLIHHELAIAWTAIALLWITWDAPNQLGAYTFFLLWGMRISAKLNLFFGVPNFSDEFLPERLRYLSSYFAKRRMNWLFPFSAAIGTALAGWLLWRAAAPEATPVEVASLTLLGTLAALATIEHWFLVLPLPDAALWRWLVVTPEQRRMRRARLTAPSPSETRR